MAYALAFGLILLGLWLILDRARFALDNSRWQRVRWLVDTSTQRGQRLSRLGFAVFGVVFVCAGIYVIAVAARII